jgi:hypothetical protein
MVLNESPQSVKTRRSWMQLNNRISWLRFVRVIQVWASIGEDQILVSIPSVIPGKETRTKAQKTVPTQLPTDNSHLIPHVPEPSSYHGPQHLMRCVKKVGR